MPSAVRQGDARGTQLGVARRPSRRWRPACGRPASRRRAGATSAADRAGRPPRAGARVAQAGHPALRRRPATTASSARVDRGALGQGGALAPALAVVGDDPHEEQRAHPVHAGGGPDVARGTGGRPRTSSTPVELHRRSALPPRHRRSQLVRSSVLARMAEWQTRRPQKPLSERACGFESRSGHGVMSRIFWDT